MIKCTDGCCPKAEGRHILFSTVSNTPYAFHETFICTDTSLIYCIVCGKCGKLYIGLTSNSLKVRFRAHQHSSETRKLILLYGHFARKSHNFLRDHRIILLEHCEPDALAEREAYWIRTLHTLIPHGLNSAYGKPYYPYNHSLSSPSLSSTGTPLPRSLPRSTPSLLSTFLFCKVGLKAGLYFNLGFPGVFPQGFPSGYSLEDAGQHPPKSHYFTSSCPSFHLHTLCACPDKTARKQPSPGEARCSKECLTPA